MFRSKKGTFLTPLSIRITGAVIGSAGFFLIAYNNAILGTALVGVGSLVIAVGEN